MSQINIWLAYPILPSFHHAALHRVMPVLRRQNFTEVQSKHPKSLMNSPTRFEAHGELLSKLEPSYQLFTELKFH